MSRRCSSRICGVQLQRFPAHESGGSAIDASEVGDKGAKNNASCPATNEVFAQSRCIVPVRNRSMPMVTPLDFGKLPGEIELHVAASLCPGKLGPKHFQAQDRLSQRASEIVRGSGKRPHRNMGEIGIVDRTAVAEQVEKQKTGQSNSVLRSAFYLGLVLVITLLLSNCSCSS